jgi:hypothetical protein
MPLAALPVVLLGALVVVVGVLVLAAAVKLRNRL